MTTPNQSSEKMCPKCGAKYTECEHVLASMHTSQPPQPSEERKYSAEEWTFEAFDEYKAVGGENFARIYKGAEAVATTTKEHAAIITRAVNELNRLESAGLSMEDIKETSMAHFNAYTKGQETITQLRAQLEEAKNERDRACALVASYDRQDELIGTEFEGVDEVTDVIRLLKQERDQLKAQVKDGQEALEWIKKYSSFVDDLIHEKTIYDSSSEVIAELRAILSKQTEKK